MKISTGKIVGSPKTLTPSQEELLATNSAKKVIVVFELGGGGFFKRLAPIGSITEETKTLDEVYIELFMNPYDTQIRKSSNWMKLVVETKSARPSTIATYYTKNLQWVFAAQKASLSEFIVAY